MTEDPLLVSSPSEISPQELVSQLLAEFRNQYGLDLAQDPAAIQRIQEAVEIALRSLQHKEEAEIYLPYLSANSAGPIHLHRIIRRGASGFRDIDNEEEKIPEPDLAAPQVVQVPLPDHKAFVT